MATKVHMEALSPTMEEGQIVKWLKSEGDAVENGEVLAEVETDKATMELVARGSGILRKVLIGEGDTAPVGEVIAVIGEEDEDISDLVDDAGSEASDESEEKETSKKEETSEGTGATEDPESGKDATPKGKKSPKSRSDRESGESEAPSEGRDGDRIKASPLARRLAEDAGIELAAISGSGPGGRIVKKDVEEAAEEQEAAAEVEAPPARERETAPARPAPEPWSDAGATEGYEEVKVSQMRKTIARRLTESLSPVPHFFLTIEVDMGRVVEARKSLNAVIEKDGDKVSFNDFVLKATAVALKRHPWCNAAWHDDTIRKFEHVHIGVAVAVDEGLITPVIQHADRKGLVQISREVKELAGRARKKKLKPEEYTGSTFSISNLGMFGIREFTAIINPPEAGILAIGAVEEIPVAENGEVVIRPRMRMTMSCDHRVIDGATGSQFLATLRALLEEPAAMLL